MIAHFVAVAGVFGSSLPGYFIARATSFIFSFTTVIVPVGGGMQQSMEKTGFIIPFFASDTIAILDNGTM
jgi:ABC-type dipeptide/oligopeptide/nickel transport system permease component